MLIIMEHGWSSAFEFFFNIETLRRFNIFQIYAAEGWLHGSDQNDQFI